MNSGDQVFGITSGCGDPSQGLYGTGRSGYSINDFINTHSRTSKSLPVHGKM